MGGLPAWCLGKGLKTSSRNVTQGDEKTHKMLVGKPDGKRPLGRSRRRWKDNIIMDFREIGWEGAERIRLTEDRDQWRAVVNTVINFRVP
jgi:hypothetical protein